MVVNRIEVDISVSVGTFLAQASYFAHPSYLCTGLNEKAVPLMASLALNDLEVDEYAVTQKSDEKGC